MTERLLTALSDIGEEASPVVSEHFYIVYEHSIGLILVSVHAYLHIAPLIGQHANVGVGGIMIV